MKQPWEKPLNEIYPVNKIGRNWGRYATPKVPAIDRPHTPRISDAEAAASRKRLKDDYDRRRAERRAKRAAAAEKRQQREAYLEKLARRNRRGII